MDLYEAISDFIEAILWDKESEWMKKGDYDFRNIITLEELQNHFSDSDENEVRAYYHYHWDDFDYFRGEYIS
jgi:hypothetical protein